MTYLIVWIVLTGVPYADAKFFIYLTNQGFLLLTLNQVARFSLTLYGFIKKLDVTGNSLPIFQYKYLMHIVNYFDKHILNPLYWIIIHLRSLFV